MLRRLLTSWFVSSSTLSTTAAAHLLQGLAHVLLDCGVGHAGQSTANAIDDLKPGLPFSDHALEFVGADDADQPSFAGATAPFLGPAPVGLRKLLEQSPQETSMRR